jgi:hypothetical protein
MLICRTGFYTYRTALVFALSFLEELSLYCQKKPVWVMSPCCGRPTEQTYFLTLESIFICLWKKTFHYVLKELLYKNIVTLVTAVTVFLCVISEVNKET